MYNSNSYREYRTVDNEFKKIKIGVQTLEDAILNLGSLNSSGAKLPYADKKLVYKAIIENNVPLMRQISNFYYNTNGIYSRTCNYFAFLYRYDWYIAPELDSQLEETSEAARKKLLKDFDRVLSFLDNSSIKKVCGDIALQVIKNGC